MKKLFKLLAVLLVLLCIGIGAVFYATSGLVESAATFIEAAKTKNYGLAYNSVSNGFKAATSQEQFAAFLESSGISDTDSISWTSRSVTPGNGTLEGTIVTKGGETIPLRIGLVKEDGAWKIHSIDKSPAGISDHGVATVPSSDDAIHLVQETIKAFALAVNAKDFTTYHRYIAKLWQEQITPQQLNEIFAPFIESELDLLPLRNLRPILDSNPEIADGVLVLKGYYDSKPSKISFQLKYVREEMAWKNVGTKIDSEAVGSE